MRLVLPHNKTRLIEMVQELVTEPKCSGGWLWQFEKFNPETGKWDKSQPMKWEHAKQARAQAMLDAATGILMIPRKRHEAGRCVKGKLMKNKLRCLFTVAVTRLVRRLSLFAWKEMMWDVSRVEWKYGRADDGTPKNWDEWNNVRDHLREAGQLRKPEELPQTNAKSAGTDASEKTP